MYGISEIKKVIKDGVRISEIGDDSVLVAQLEIYLKYVFNDLGQVHHKDDVDYLKKQLIFLLRNKYSFLRTAEIGIAFRNGIQKVYGEYFGINFVSLSLFIKSYAESTERCDANVQLQTETRSERLISAPSQEFDGEAWVSKLYAEYLEKGTCEDLGNLAYDYLNKNNRIDLTKEQKTEIWDQAQKLCKEKIEKDKASSNNFYQFKELEKKLIEVMQTSRAPMVVVKAKQLALLEHFKQLTTK